MSNKTIIKEVYANFSFPHTFTLSTYSEFNKYENVEKLKISWLYRINYVIYILCKSGKLLFYPHF